MTADEVIAGKFHDRFFVGLIRGGAGPIQYSSPWVRSPLPTKIAFRLSLSPPSE